jgi:hypothetical protein
MVIFCVNLLKYVGVYFIPRTRLSTNYKRGDIIATAIPQFPINLVIPIASESEGKLIEKVLADALAGNEFLSKTHYVNPDESQRARLLINGEEVKRGTVEMMKEAFRFQTDINPKANITVQEWQKPAAIDKPAIFVTILHRGVRIL